MTRIPPISFKLSIMDCSVIGNPRRLSLPMMLRGLLMRLLIESIGFGLPEMRDSSLRISSLVLISRMPDSYSIIICCICIADSISISSSCCDSRSIAKKSASSIVFFPPWVSLFCSYYTIFVDWVQSADGDAFAGYPAFAQRMSAARQIFVRAYIFPDFRPYCQQRR